MKAPLPWDEDIRLKELLSYHILDTPNDKDFDELVELAAQICACPIASITFVDKERQWFKSKKGLDTQETSRDISFCAHTIVEEDILIVEDALEDERFSDNPFVLEGLHVRFYAGAPVYSASGFKLGTVCVIDNQPRTLTPKQLEALKMISHQITKLLELKIKNQKLNYKAELLSEEKRKSEENHYTSFFNNGVLPQWIVEETSFRFLSVNEAAKKLYGYDGDAFLKMSISEVWPQTSGEWSSIKEEISHSNTPVKKEAVHLKKNGEKMWVEVAFSNIFYHGKIAWLITISDISEKIKLQESLTSQHNLQAKKITGATIAAQEKEREHIGKEIHDNIYQILKSTKLFLELAQTNKELKEELIERSKRNIVDALSETKSLCKFLVSPTFKEHNLINAIEDLIESYSVTRQFDIHFIYRGNVESIPGEVKLALFRIIQEQLENINQHADASDVWIYIRKEDTIELSIKDDGQGYDAKTKEEGVGFYNIRCRVELYNGTVEVITSPGNGCYITISIPSESNV